MRSKKSTKRNAPDWAQLEKNLERIRDLNDEMGERWLELIGYVTELEELVPLTNVTWNRLEEWWDGEMMNDSECKKWVITARKLLRAAQAGDHRKIIKLGNIPVRIGLPEGKPASMDEVAIKLKLMKKAASLRTSDNPPAMAGNRR